MSLCIEHLVGAVEDLDRAGQVETLDPVVGHDDDDDVFTRSVSRVAAGGVGGHGPIVVGPDRGVNATSSTIPARSPRRDASTGAAAAAPVGSRVVSGQTFSSMQIA